MRHGTRRATGPPRHTTPVAARTPQGNTPTQLLATVHLSPEDVPTPVQDERWPADEQFMQGPMIPLSPTPSQEDRLLRPDARPDARVMAESLTVLGNDELEMLYQQIAQLRQWRSPAMPTLMARGIFRAVRNLALPSDHQRGHEWMPRRRWRSTVSCLQMTASPPGTCEHSTISHDTNETTSHTQ